MNFVANKIAALGSVFTKVEDRIDRWYGEILGERVHVRRVRNTKMPWIISKNSRDLPIVEYARGVSLSDAVAKATQMIGTKRAA